jgi:TIR domain
VVSSSPVPVRPIEVFFFYAHRDATLRDELAKHLSLLQNQKVIAGWYDRQIPAGTEWSGAIEAHLEHAQIILLLISADFMASEYCYGIEMQRAMERHEAGQVRVIPIILRAVDWHSAPFGKLQALPKDGRPVTRWTDRDEAFFDIARGIRSIAEELAQNP